MSIVIIQLPIIHFIYFSFRLTEYLS